MIIDSLWTVLHLDGATTPFLSLRAHGFQPTYSTSPSLFHRGKLKYPSIIMLTCTYLRYVSTSVPNIAYTCITGSLYLIEFGYVMDGAAPWSCYYLHVFEGMWRPSYSMSPSLFHREAKVYNYSTVESG